METPRTCPTPRLSPSAAPSCYATAFSPPEAPDAVGPPVFELPMERVPARAGHETHAVDLSQVELPLVTVPVWVCQHLRACFSFGPRLSGAGHETKDAGVTQGHAQRRSVLFHQETLKKKTRQSVGLFCAWVSMRMPNRRIDGSRANAAVRMTFRLIFSADEAEISSFEPHQGAAATAAAQAEQHRVHART